MCNLRKGGAKRLLLVFPLTSSPGQDRQLDQVLGALAQQRGENLPADFTAHIPLGLHGRGGYSVLPMLRSLKKSSTLRLNSSGFSILGRWATLGMTTLFAPGIPVATISEILRNSGTS